MDIIKVIILSVVMLLLGIFLGIVISKKKNKKKESAEKEKSKVVISKKIESFEDGYERFIPFKLLMMLDIENISKDSLKIQKEFESAIMECNLIGFNDIINEMESKSAYEMINSIMNESLPVIDERGGIVDSFSNAGVRAVFVNNYENILNAAVTICENMSIRTSCNNFFDRFSIGLAYGDTMVGMVGVENRMDALVLSMYTRLASHLQSICSKYYCKILATGSLIELIPDAKTKFNMRFIGYIYISETKQLEKIYDVFDGDIVDIRNQKRKTKKVFENGVELFTKRQFLEARNHFIEVMKTDRKDSAAKAYLLECEKYISKDYEDDVLTYIEKM